MKKLYKCKHKNATAVASRCTSSLSKTLREGLGKFLKENHITDTDRLGANKIPYDLFAFYFCPECKMIQFTMLSKKYWETVSSL